MGGTKMKTVDMSMDVTDEPKKNRASSHHDESEKAANKRKRSKNYVYARSQVDRTKSYDVKTAVGLVQKLSKKAHPTITADINVREDGISFEISLPHATGKQVKVAIVDDSVLEALDAGTIDFDVLLAKPEMMAKVAKYARVLGPRGLMPNPKNGTVTAEPEKRKKELEAGSMHVKTEKKFPIMHVQVGNAKQSEDEVAENIMALVKRIGLNKISKVTLSSTMSPGVRVELASLKQE